MGRRRSGFLSAARVSGSTPPRAGTLARTVVLDTVTEAELGDEELTYDLSVPDNVTYVANGFVSHNTIGLMMDCDTTGSSPISGLCKMKKLVGGGTMTIVNQTVPRALRRLGYTDAQVDEIVAYVDEHKTILGAPYLTARTHRRVRVLHGRQHDPLPGRRQDDGGVRAVHLGRDQQDVNMPRTSASRTSSSSTSTPGSSG